jgi:hypothetical protein
MKAGETRPEFL